MRFTAKVFSGLVSLSSSFCNFAHAQGNKAIDTDRIVVKIDGKPQAITSYNHKPYFSVGSIDELRKYFDVVKPYLPKMPFKIQGQWVIPGTNGGIRTFRDFPEFWERFSENGDYVALIAPERRDADYQVASPEFYFMTTDYEWLWRTREGPTWVYVLNDGRLINRQNHPGPMDLRFYDARGKLTARTTKVFSYDPGGEPAFVQWLPQYDLVVTHKGNEIAGIDFSGQFLWRHLFQDISRSSLSGVSVGQDPLGRGLYLFLGDSVVDDENGQTMKFMAPRSGEMRPGFWEREPVGRPHLFSPDGQWVFMNGGSRSPLVNWKTGEALPAGEWQALHGRRPNEWLEPVSISNAPLRVAFRNDSVYDATGKEIWKLRLLDAGPHRIVLSDDGKTAAAILESKESNSDLTLRGILLYKIDE